MDSKKYKVNEVNAWNGWDPLKQVILGNCFAPEFFEEIGDPKLRDLLQQILYETQEDLDNIQKTLEDLGVEVVRMSSNSTSYLGEVYSNSGNGEIQGFPKPCLMPRDDFITLGNRILCTALFRDGEINQNSIFNPKSLDILFQDEWEQYKLGKIPHGPLKPTSAINPNEFSSFESTFNFWAPAVHRVGNKLIVDHEDWSNLSDVILERYPEFTSANVTVGGHTDGSMNLPKPGLVVCGPWMGPEDFKDTLPGWDVLRIEHPNRMQSEMGSWATEKHITQGKWWTPEAKSNPELVDFVDNWLTNWVGYAEESIFEVNMLSVNPETILSLNYQPEVHNALKKHGIEPIYCRFRHRNFWDGGLHCLTLDTVREGGIQDYFK